LIFVLSLFFQRAQGLSALRAGLAFAPMTAVVLAANLVGGRVSAGPRARAVLVGGAALLGLASLALLRTGSGTSYGAIVGQLIAIGFGLGLIVPIITSMLLGAVDAARSGVAAGTLNTARQAGSVIGVAIYGSLTVRGIVQGLHVGLIISAAIALAVLVIVVRGRAHESDRAR
jgi:MFS transporter, DHA2 family, methylenomycin A resistance protein